MKKLILNLLNKIGYDLIKITKRYTVYKSKSDFNHLSYHPTPIGNYYLPLDSDKDIIALHMKRGMYFEPEIIEIAKKYIKPDTIVIDIGANFGQMSIEFSKLVGNNGLVYSFEAQNFVYDILLKNFEINNCKNVNAFYRAVYNKEGVTLVFPEIDLKVNQCYGAFGLNPTVNSGTEIKSITIDSIDFEKPISFMKIDIQGCDLLALLGAEKTILKHKMPILFEFEQQFQEQFNTTFQDYVDFVKKINYRFVRTIMANNYLIVPNE